MLLDRVGEFLIPIAVIPVSRISTPAPTALVIVRASALAAPIIIVVAPLSPMLLLLLLPLWRGTFIMVGGAVLGCCCQCGGGTFVCVCPGCMLYAVWGIKYADCGGPDISSAARRLSRSLTFPSAADALSAY